MAERNAERRGLERRDEKPWRLISVEGDKINAVRLGVESRKNLQIRKTGEKG